MSTPENNTTTKPSILSALSGMKRASAADIVAKVAMTEGQESLMKTQLKEGNRMNVYPNKFNVDQPYRVQMRTGSTFKTHGYFTDVDVATAVGTICSKAAFGDKALAGEYDPAKVENHPEFVAWLADDRNQVIIAKATA